MQVQTSWPEQASYSKVIVEIICYAHVVLFIYAGIYKLLDFHFFVITLSRSPLIGGLAQVLAWLVPLVEIVSALLLLSPRSRLAGMWASLAIMSGFTLYIAYLFTFAPEVPCSCGGILGMMGWEEHLVFNLLFVGMGITGIALFRKINSH